MDRIIGLIIVAIILMAGFLFSEDLHALRDRQIADASVEQVLLDNMKHKTMVAELTQQVAATGDHAAAVSTRAAAAETQAAVAEATAAAASTLAAESLNKAVVAGTIVAAAETRAAEADTRAAAAEAEATEAYRQVMGMDNRMIPMTGQTPTPTSTPAPQAQSVKVIGPLQWLVPGIGLLFFGLLAVISVGWRVLNNSPRTFGGQTDAKDVTYVKMTREEARLYGRGRRV